MKTIYIILALLFMLSFNLEQTTAQQQSWRHIPAIDTLQSNWIYSLASTPVGLIASLYVPEQIPAPANYERNRVLVSYNRGFTWTEARWNGFVPVPGLMIFGDAVMSSSSQTFLFALQLFPQRLVTSQDSGKTWGIVAPQKTVQNTQSENVVYADDLLGLGNKLFIVWQNRLFYSLDGGKTILWDSSGFNIQTPIIGFRRVTKSRSTLWAAAGNGYFSSVDTGRTWTKRTDPIGTERGGFIPATESVIFAQTFKDSLLQSFYSQYISQDTGKSWKQLSLLTPKETISNAISFGSRIYLATTPGLFYSDDQGQTWQKESGRNGLPEGRIRSSALSGTTLFVSVNERGLYTLDLTTVSTREEPQNALFISSPAPNPSSDYTTITFNLLRAAEAGVTLYSTLGTEVWHSESAHLSAGEQHIRIDTHHLPTGVYAYRLMVDGVSSVGRIVVVR